MSVLGRELEKLRDSWLEEVMSAFAVNQDREAGVLNRAIDSESF